MIFTLSRVVRDSVEIRSRRRGDRQVEPSALSRTEESSMMLYKLLCVIVAASLGPGCHGARILAVFPTPSRSHMIAFEPLTLALAARGHQLTVVSMYPLKEPVANYTDITVPINFYGMDKIDKFEMGQGFDLMKVLRFLQLGERTCEHFLENPGVQTLVNAKDDSFDLLMVTVFFNECFLGFAHKFNVPVIGILPMMGTHWMLDTVGNPSPYAYIPNPILGYSDHMTFTQRLVNTLSILGATWLRNLIILPAQDTLMRKYFNASGPLPYVGDLESKTSLMLVNSHVSISYPRPYLPNTVEVGGMHVKPGKKLSKDLQKYLDEATDGVVYFSMGSNLKSSQLPESKRQAFLDAFSKMKQRILWKWEEESLPGQPKNVKLGKWLPQSSILGHPNVKVFVTHGGLLSMQEAVYNSVPTISIPIFGDQELNANNAVLLGLGVKLAYKNITSDSLQWALNRVLNEPSYLESAKRLSARFRDQPDTPLERAVFWTEYVIRHDGAQHLRSAALDLAWYQYLLLDVLALLLLGVVVLYLAVRALVALVCGGKHKDAKKSKKNN